MVVQTRTDVRRNRLLYILTIILSIAVLITAFLQYSESSDGMRAVFLILSIGALISIVLSAFQLYGLPHRSSVILIHKGDEMIVARGGFDLGTKCRPGGRQTPVGTFYFRIRRAPIRTAGPMGFRGNAF